MNMTEKYHTKGIGKINASIDWMNIITISVHLRSCVKTRWGIVRKEKRENTPYSGFYRSSRPQSKIEERKTRLVLGTCQRTEKVVEYDDNGDTYCDWRTWNSPQKLGKAVVRDGNWRTNWGHPNYNINIG